MYNIFIQEASLPSAYHSALSGLYAFGDESDCADWNQKQLEASLCMVVTEPFAEPMISKLFIGEPKSLQKYTMEMLDGILDFEVEDGKWAYTYHDRITNYGDGHINQIEFVINELRRNPSSRRAVICVRDVMADYTSSEPACLQSLQYFIRENKLVCHAMFRSNDACKATFMNAFALIMLQKKIADELEVGVGEYRHIANSFHCYENDFKLLEGYVSRINKSESNTELAYNFYGDWADEMNSCTHEILEEVHELKLRNGRYTCADCKYCHMLKELVHKEGDLVGMWVLKSICTVFPETEKDSGYDSFAMVIENINAERCEMFRERDKK